MLKRRASARVVSDAWTKVTYIQDAIYEEGVLGQCVGNLRIVFRVGARGVSALEQQSSRAGEEAG